MSTQETGYTSRIELYNGRQTLFINDQPVAPLIYHLTGGSATRTWEPIPQNNLRSFTEAGYRLFGTEIWMSKVWSESGELDLDFVRRQIQAVLRANHDAAILLRLHVDAPEWWLDRHPEERSQAALTPSDRVPEHVRRRLAEFKAASFASDAWKRAMGEKVVEFLQRLSATPEGDTLFAIHVAGGAWGEWFYDAFELEPDTGPAMTRHFRLWLRDKYETDKALQEAWNDPAATLGKARVPSVEERFRTVEKMFRDPRDDRRAIDYYKCHQELVAETPLHFCRLVKETWPRPIVVGVFHGYFFHLTHQASGGHLEMGRVLDSPYVDYLASPLSYEYDSRFVGGSGHFRCLTESVRAHGKLWMSEVDHPTFLGDHFMRPGPFSPATVEDSIATMRRNVAHIYTLGQGMWWYDFGPPGRDGQGGWWDHPALLQEAGRLRELAERLLNKPYEPCADVLLVYDTECFYYLGQMYLGVYHPSMHWERTETLSFEAANRTVADAYKSGAAFETVHLNDLPLIDLDRYRVVIFAFTPYLSKEHRAFISKEIVRPGRTVVWVYAPGYTDGHTPSVDRVSDTTGISVAKSTVNLPPQLLIREGAITAGFPETRLDVSIQDAWTIPTFQVVDNEAEVLGYYGGSREVALAKKRVNGATVWFCALPLKNPRLMREMFRSSGAHIYNEKNDVLHAGGSVIWIHTETGGTRTIRLRNGRTVVMELKPWSTVVLDSDTGDLLLP